MSMNLSPRNGHSLQRITISLKRRLRKVTYQKLSLLRMIIRHLISNLSYSITHLWSIKILMSCQKIKRKRKLQKATLEKNSIRKWLLSANHPSLLNFHTKSISRTQNRENLTLIKHSPHSNFSKDKTMLK